VPVAYWEAFGADLGLRLVFETIATFSFAFSALAFSPPCGGTGNPVEGAIFLIPGIAALIGQPFAMAGITGALFHGQKLQPKYWAAFWGDVVATLLLAPAAGLLFGEVVNLASNQNGDNSTPAIVIGIAAFVIGGAFGAPSGANFSLPAAQPQPTTPISRAPIGAPLIRLSFN
jgi:hypothetical protein